MNDSTVPTEVADSDGEPGTDDPGSRVLSTRLGPPRCGIRQDVDQARHATDTHLLPKRASAGNLTANFRGARSSSGIARLEGGRRDDSSSFDRRRVFLQLRRVE